MLKIKTKYGELWAQPNNGQDVYLDTRKRGYGPDDHDLPMLSIFGVEYHVNAHINLHQDGHWRVGYEAYDGKVRTEWARRNETIYGHRGNGNFDGMTWKARDAFFAELEQVADKWAAEHKAELKAAELLHVGKQIQKKVEEIEAAAKAMTTMQSELYEMEKVYKAKMKAYVGN